jgi:hypothetical protein
MSTYDIVVSAQKTLVNEPFFNQGYMSVGIIQNKQGEFSMKVYLHKKIRTDNLPREIDSIKIDYEYIGQIKPL